MDKITEQCTTNNAWYENLMFVNNFTFKPNLKEYLDLMNGDISVQDAYKNHFSI
jgi:hypothetical protein